MTPAERLAAIVTALEAVGLRCLVMGGHAVRYYGFDRNTVDFDLHLAEEGWDNLSERLAYSVLAAGPIVEGHSWRPGAFRRFLIGRLPDGREEWLEFWRSNHLLAPFADLDSRREVGAYGGRVLPFLGLADLIRSKETERESDWDDIRVLEEFLDARRFAAVQAGHTKPLAAVSGVRSRKGFERLYQEGLLRDSVLVGQALNSTDSPMSWAYLRPFVADPVEPPPDFPLEAVVKQKLQTVAPASSAHLSVVEIVRRQYKTIRKAEDAEDKQAIRSGRKS